MIGGEQVTGSFTWVQIVLVVELAPSAGIIRDDPPLAPGGADPDPTLTKVDGEPIVTAVLLKILLFLTVLLR